MKRIVHTRHQHCELQDEDQRPLAEHEIAGPSLATLVSPGTELASAYCADSFPRGSGYASVFTVEELGSAVTGFERGDQVFIMGGHASWQCCDAAAAIKIPVGLDPQQAVLARLMGVSHTTLVTTRARAGDKVFITGLGPVGYLAAVQFLIGGFEVYASDPDQRCRDYAAAAGVHIVDKNDDVKEIQAAIAIDCSGHESAVLQCADAVRRCGEVVLIGVPWKQRSDDSAHALLHKVFHNYVYLRSGWEWELPRRDGHFNQMRNLKDNFAICLRWLSEGRVPIPEGLIGSCDPNNCDAVYKGHLEASHPHLCSVFDWTLINTKAQIQEA